MFISTGRKAIEARRKQSRADAAKVLDARRKLLGAEAAQDTLLSDSRLLLSRSPKKKRSRKMAEACASLGFLDWHLNNDK